MLSFTQRVRTIYANKCPEELRKSKLLYLSKWRGNPENGILLTSFAEKWLNTLSDQELTEYETVLQMDEPDLYKFLIYPEDKLLSGDLNIGILRKIRGHIHSSHFLNREGAKMHDTEV